MRKRWAVAAAILLTSLMLTAFPGAAAPSGAGPSRLRLALGADYFLPAALSMKNIYGRGWGWAGEADFGLGQRFEVWVDASGWTKEGGLPFTGEATSMSLLAFGTGLKIRFELGPIALFAGAGPGLVLYKESNPIGRVSGKGFGPVATAGLRFKIAAGLFLGAEARYGRFVVRPLGTKADLGGVKTGLRLGYSFF